MVYYKRAVLASCFALASSISAKEGTPSLKEIIHEIPEDNVRGRIETAYMNGNFDEVEKGLFSYLDEYDFDNSAVENVQEVKEKAWSIISERVEEMRTAGYDEAGPAGEDAGPSPAGEDAGPSPAGEDAGPSPSEDASSEFNIDEFLNYLGGLTLEEIVDKMNDGEAKTKILNDINENKGEALTDADFDHLIESVPLEGLSEEDIKRVEELIHEKVHEHFHPEDANVGEPQLMEGKSDIVGALHDIAVTQQKIVELINELEGGL